MNTAAVNGMGPDDAAFPRLQPGLVEELTGAYAAFLKQQRTTSAAYVRWTPSHSRAHEFAWLDSGQEALLMGGGNVIVGPNSPL